MTYSLSTYEPNDGDDGFGWLERAAGLTLWQLRPALRLWRQWYDTVSILVQRSDR